MNWIKKNWIMVITALLVVVGLWMYFKKSSAKATTSTLALGKKKDGSDYFESDVQKKMDDIRSDKPWSAKVMAEKDKSKSFEEALRINAIFCLEKLD